MQEPAEVVKHTVQPVGQADLLKWRLYVSKCKIYLQIKNYRKIDILNFIKLYYKGSNIPKCNCYLLNNLYSLLRCHLCIHYNLRKNSLLMKVIKSTRTWKLSINKKAWIALSAKIWGLHVKKFGDQEGFGPEIIFLTTSFF